MTKFVSIRANGDEGPVVTVTEAFAKSIEAEVLPDEPAVDKIGRPLEPRELGAYENPPEPSFAPAITLPEKTDDQSDVEPDLSGYTPPNLDLGDPNNPDGDDADHA